MCNDPLNSYLERPDSGNQFDENVDTIIQMAETAHQIQGFWPMTKHYRICLKFTKCRATPQLSRRQTPPLANESSQPREYPLCT